MTVTASRTVGTIGGGHLEFDAVARARRALCGEVMEQEVRYILGANLGQCCGGVVWLRFTRVASDEHFEALLPPQQRLPLGLFGAGHVGRAIASIARDLPIAVHWVDSREGQFPESSTPRGWHQEVCDPPADAVADLPSGTAVLVMTHSHAEDFDIIVSCLVRQRERTDLAFIGLIGSNTKWASFRGRLRARGFSENELAHVVCPIGIPGVRGKQPAAIAVAVLAQILTLPP